VLQHEELGNYHPGHGEGDRGSKVGEECLLHSCMPRTDVSWDRAKVMSSDHDRP
jgi:hypothetical protein